MSAKLFWELHQSRRMQPAQADAGSAPREVTDVDQRLRDLERGGEKTLLVCEALWTLLRDKLGVADEELLERVREVDLTGGRLDGRVRRRPRACPKCERTNPPRLANCMYCAKAIQPAAPPS